MITDLECAQACFDSYAYAGPVGWDWQQEVSGVWVAVRRIGTSDLVVFRGSTTFNDWIRDMFTVADPLDVDGLGPVHPGFYLGLTDVWKTISPRLVAGNWACTGHSLGAGRCCLFAGIAQLNHMRPERYVRFGEPRPGFKKLADVLDQVAGVSFRAADANGHDLVTNVPFYLPPLEDYVHPQPLIDVMVHPAADDPWFLFKYHHMSGYLAATPTGE